MPRSIHLKLRVLTKHIPRMWRPLFAACLLPILASCASTTNLSPPPPGRAVIDAMPEAHRRDRVEAIGLVSINGGSVNGTRSDLTPGPNTVRARFRWPHGFVQEVDLSFYATAGTLYFVNYTVFPPDSEDSATMAGRFMNSAGHTSDPGVVVLAFIAPLVATVAVGEKIAHRARQASKVATYMDLTVVAHRSSEGIVRQVRAYPDGRVDEKPWAPWAQMRAPR
jgi:hypothetical protein